MSCSAYLLKKANEALPQDSRKELEGIMNRIYEEAPWKWPYGLSVGAHDEVYMIRKTASMEPVGFTGWQERNDGDAKVGFYTIGILPEYRGSGMAKEAVSKLIAKKASSVDRVQAFIADGNVESEALAKAVGVPYTLSKQASGGGKVLGNLASALAGAVGNTVYWDQALHPEVPVLDSFKFTEYDKPRAMMAILNSALGAGSGAMIHKGVSMLRSPKPATALKGSGVALVGTGGIALSGTKDLTQQTIPVPGKIRDTLDKVREQMDKPSEPVMSNAAKLGLGVGGAAAVGLGAYGLHRLAQAVNRHTDMAQRARVKVTLPTKDPTDRETVIEVPITDLHMSAKAYRDLGRDTRREIRNELKERTMKRKKLTNAESMEKAAAQTSDPSATAARTPWAPNYAQQQMPTPATDQNLVKQVEEAHMRIDDLTQKLQLKDVKDQYKNQASGASAGASSPQTAAAPVQTAEVVKSRVNSALKLLNGRSKVASSVPAQSNLDKAAPKLPVQASEVQSGYDLGNRMFRGAPGIQTPVTPKTVPFGRTMYQAGQFANRVLTGGAQPSARAMFMEQSQPHLSWQQQLINAAPQLMYMLR